MVRCVAVEKNREPMLEPSFLNRLPPRFRERFRENMATFAVLIVLFVAPQHVGPFFGTATFFSIVLLGFTAFYFVRLRGADPPAPIIAYVLFAATMTLYAIPVGVAWTYLQLGPLLVPAESIAFLAFALATILGIVFMVIFRRIVFKYTFGVGRRNPISEIQMALQAQREAREESRSFIEQFRRERD